MVSFLLSWLVLLHNQPLQFGVLLSSSSPLVEVSVHENMVVNLVQGFLSYLLIVGVDMTTLVGCVACLWYIVTPS